MVCPDPAVAVAHSVSLPETVAPEAGLMSFGNGWSCGAAAAAPGACCGCEGPDSGHPSRAVQALHPEKQHPLGQLGDIDGTATSARRWDKEI